ncbi:MAG: UDP-N-acetylmuramoylalanyl-D-glutamyl-2, 6-diaminopimelate--D-alanyl-D-alanine ligase [Rhodospirillaceae bacterium]|nr:MAG: UDP-N-acetylmuramoylalanyl-D-glutamyl-2, 6-diaminopimelate--D-alanyl-D-alanine ligase [Rhodospirillaceae bacterium]
MTRKPLWTSREAEAATDGTGTAAWEANGVSMDSRHLKPGDLFVAISGPNFDGHAFVREAFAHGAAAAIVESPPKDPLKQAPLLIVANSFHALEALARTARERARAQIIAVTGSVGKTGTKEALRLALSESGNVLATQGNFNNEYGVPLSLARLPREADYGVFELGMNHPGEIRPLAKLVRPKIGIITNVEAVHMAHFDSVAEIADTKAEIFEGMDADGIVILNRDNPYFSRLAAAAKAQGITRILGFGEHPEAQLRLINCTCHALSSNVVAEIGGHEIHYRLGAPGRHWVTNSLAVLGAVDAVGADVKKAAAKLAGLTAPAGRGRRVHGVIPSGKIEIIDESYNANPASMRATFDTLAATPAGPVGRRIAILGDMLELGKFAPRMHAELAGDLLRHEIDLVFTVGELMKNLDREMPPHMRGGHANSAEALIPTLLEELHGSDVVAVKGSRAMNMNHIVAALRQADSGMANAANGH